MQLRLKVRCSGLFTFHGFVPLLHRSLSFGFVPPWPFWPPSHSAHPRLHSTDIQRQVCPMLQVEVPFARGCMYGGLLIETLVKLVVVLLPLGGVTLLPARHSIVNEIRGTTSALSFASRRPTASRRQALARRPGGHLWRCLCTSPSPSSQDGGRVSRSQVHAW